MRLSHTRFTVTARRQLEYSYIIGLADYVGSDVTLAECCDMEAAKTGALLAASGSVGATLAGADQRTVRAYADFGADLGIAFQFVDDLLGIWGSPETTGKPVYSDLAARKKTMPLVWCLENGGAEGERLAAWLPPSRRPSRPRPKASRCMPPTSIRRLCGAPSATSRPWGATRTKAICSRRCRRGYAGTSVWSSPTRRTYRPMRSRPCRPRPVSTSRASPST